MDQNPSVSSFSQKHKHLMKILIIGTSSILIALVFTLVIVLSAYNYASDSSTSNNNVNQSVSNSTNVENQLETLDNMSKEFNKNAENANQNINITSAPTTK